MNAEQRRKARRSTTPSPDGIGLIQAHLRLAGEHMRLRQQVADYLRTQQASMDDLRLAMTYLVFDNECLRRENAALRAELERQ